MWDRQDEFFFAWKRMKGDFQISARARFVGEGKVPHRKIGVIVRKSLAADSPYVDIALHGDGLTSLQMRRAAGEETTQIMAPIAGANVVQLERKGNKYTMRVAWDGKPFAAPREVELDLGDEVYVGVFVCSHDADESVTAEFDNVRISVPAPDDFVPYRDFIGSNLEIMDVESGRADDRLSGERLDPGAELDHRRQGAHFQSQWPAVSLRPGDPRADGDRHRLRH